MNQHVGELPSDRLGRAYVFLNKSNKAMPYLNRPWKPKRSFLDFIGNKYIDPPEDAASDRWVDTCTFPSAFDATGRAIFTPAPQRKDWCRMKDKVVRPTCVVLCTGYKQVFDWLDPAYPTSEQANIRNIINIHHPDFAFIGFVRPGVGAIPPIAEQQALWWTALIIGNMEIPRSPSHYHLLTKGDSRIKYGVDHSAYMSQLARDFGGAPGLWELYKAHGFRILLIYSFGASFVTFYRLAGPFAFDGAKKVARTELAETIGRRGLLGNLFFGLIPMMFYGIINTSAWLLDLFGLIPKEREVE
jgi:dimethylaniline monooxygenase (N-oxide forming)